MNVGKAVMVGEGEEGRGGEEGRVGRGKKSLEVGFAGDDVRVYVWRWDGVRVAAVTFWGCSTGRDKQTT